MMEIIGKANTLKTEADSYHQKVVQRRLEAQKVQEEYVDVQNRIETLTKQMTEKEEKEKIRRQDEKREALKKAALRKLKQGQKLTLEEFKLLGQEEEPT